MKTISIFLLILMNQIIVRTVGDVRAKVSRNSNDFRWAASAAGFGLLLRQAEFIGDY